VVVDSHDEGFQHFGHSDGGKNQVIWSQIRMSSTSPLALSPLAA
jgi:hypothetical protein